MPYDKKRKNVTLSSGDVLSIRRLSGMDYAKLGSIPDAFSLLVAKAAANGGKAPLTELKQLDAASLDYVCRVVCAAIVNHLPQQTLVVKQPGDCTEYEVSFFELPTSDQNLLVRAAYGFNEEGAEEALPFSGADGAAGGAGQDGQALREAADGPAQGQ